MVETDAYPDLTTITLVTAVLEKLDPAIDCMERCP